MTDKCKCEEVPGRGTQAFNRGGASLSGALRQGICEVSVWRTKMNYLEAIKVCLEGKNVRSKLMAKNEHISYDKAERRFLWWARDSHRRWVCYSYPEDTHFRLYKKWIFSDWEVYKEK
jgi:hypothetical protein